MNEGRIDVAGIAASTLKTIFLEQGKLQSSHATSSEGNDPDPRKSFKGDFIGPKWRMNPPSSTDDHLNFLARVHEMGHAAITQLSSVSAIPVRRKFLVYRKKFRERVEIADTSPPLAKIHLSQRTPLQRPSFMNEERIDVAAIAASCFRTDNDDILVVDEPSLRKFWNELSPTDEATYDYLVNLVGHQANPDDPKMNARVGGWVYHLSSGLIKGTLLAFVVTAALKSVGATDLSVAILPAVLPFLFDLERTRLSRREEQLLVTVHKLSKTEGKKTPRELYDLLPEEIQRQVNYLDFLDFIDAISMTGHVNPYAEGKIEVSHPDSPNLIVIVR